MKTPLFFIISLILACVVCSCQKTYYHSEVCYPDLKGQVKKLVENVYKVANENPDDLQLTSTNEIYFDSIGRLVGEKYINYDLTTDTATNVDNQPLIVNSKKHTYDWYGRKIELLLNSTSWQTDEPEIITTTLKLTKSTNNHELWEEIITDDSIYIDPDLLKRKEFFYSKDMLKIIERNHRGTITTMYTFGRKNCLIHYKQTASDGFEKISTYEYDENCKVISVRHEIPSLNKIMASTYTYDHFDNEDNWHKRFEYDEQGKLTFVLIRSIEYR